jgi:DNA-binding transcriptional MerR regulator
VTHFTTREVARIAILPDARIRSCVRAGLLSPRRGRKGRLEWSFQDLLLLKTTKGLLDARVPLARIRRMMASLKRQLPDDRTLSSLTIYADGRRVVAWDGTARWQPDSGQFLFNFDVQEIASEVSRAERLPAAALEAAGQPARTAEQWFNLGYELDAVSP